MPRYKVFAAIDLGSTEITMKIAEVSKKNGISVLDTVKYDLSIGKESYAVGKISYNLVDKICNCFEEYLRIMKSYGGDGNTLPLCGQVGAIKGCCVCI